MNLFLEVFTGILKTPAIILGLVALVGLLLQKKPGAAVVRGTIKTILGLLMLAAGAGFIVNCLIPFSEMFSKAFNLTGIVPFDEAVIGAVTAKIPEIATGTTLIMTFGFMVNLILARVTPFKYIYLTGHMIWISAGSISWALHDNGVNLLHTVIFGSMIQGICCILFPALAQPFMRKVTGGDTIAYSHLTTTGVVAAGFVGGLLGNKNKDAEDLELPESISFLKDINLSISVTMILIFVITGLFAGSGFVADFAQGQHYIVYNIINALNFTVGVLILLQGVRMFLGEIVPAFQGIAVKMVPGAIPALDCPAVFAYAPTALMIGFVLCIVGMISGMAFCGMIGGVIPLPSIIGAFFTGGTSGIFGNAVGGRRGAAVAGFVYGLICTIPVALFYPLFPLQDMGIEGVSMLCADALIIMSLIKFSFVSKVPLLFFVALLTFVGVLSVLKHKKNYAASDKTLN